MRIYIRADGGPAIGSGHIMRCLAIATALRKAGTECTFLTADNAMAGTIAAALRESQGPYSEAKGTASPGTMSEREARTAGAGVHQVLGGDPGDLSGEIPAMQRLLAAHPGSTLLVDTYAATPAYLAALLPHTRLWVMDDLGEAVFPCHGIIAYNVYTNIGWYEVRYPTQQRLLGPAYAPLRAEFRDPPARDAADPVRAVAITTGGTDPLGMAEALLRGALARPALAALRYEVVAGAFHPGLAALHALSEAHPHIRVHTQVTRMASLLTACDVAVSACGSTLYELCACGTPGAIFAFADNQLPALAAFAERGYFLGAGDARVDALGCVDRLLDAMEVLAGDAALRVAMSEKMRALVDGQGARRIAAEMTSPATTMIRTAKET